LSEKAVLKVFTTGNLTIIGKRSYFIQLEELICFVFLLAPYVERINTAVNDFYPQLYECRKLKQNEGQC
jgi:hypothetical protein